jgi:hypothetical protein
MVVPGKMIFIGPRSMRHVFIRGKLLNFAKKIDMTKSREIPLSESIGIDHSRSDSESNYGESRCFCRDPLIQVNNI